MRLFTKLFHVRRSHLDDHFDRENDRYDANARLIAAAPDLLDALIKAQYELRDHGHGPDCPAMGRIDAAIARATGEKE